MKLFTSIFLFIVACLLYGCKSQQNINDNSLNFKWQLISLNGKEANTLFPEKVTELEFNTIKKSLSGYGRCNEYVGSYTLTGDKFYAPNLMSTMKMCPSMQYEDLYTRMLSKRLKISVSNDELTLSEKGKDVLVFKKMETSNTNYIVTTKELFGEWELQTIQGKDVSAYFKADNIPVIEFDSSSVKGNAGCNGYQGPFTISGNELEIGMLKMTRMYCDNMEGERLFSRLLSGKSDITISDNSLIFNKEGKTALSFQKK